MTHRERGFTLVELLVIGPVMLLATITAMTFLFNQYGQIVKQDGQLRLRMEAQNLLFGFQDDLWFANQFSSTINSNLSDPYEPSGGWSNATSPPTLIISLTALTTNQRDPNRQPVYINESTCTPPDGDGANSILYNNTIYFLEGTNLYKRTLTAPAGLATCGTSYEKQTCPEANSSPTCRADPVLSDHVTSFSVTYYDEDNVVTATPEEAESVEVSLALTDKAFGEDVTATSNLRLRKLNQ
jgi:type II secretory pathway pseudopilin PulG